MVGHRSRSPRREMIDPAERGVFYQRPDTGLKAPPALRGSAMVAQTHQTANLCGKLNCASLPRPQGRANAHSFQQPDLENHWVPMPNRALP